MGIIIDYHKEWLQKDPIAGRELVRLNKTLIDAEIELEHPGELGKMRTAPIKAVRKIKSKKKRRRK